MAVDAANRAWFYSLNMEIEARHDIAPQPMPRRLILAGVVMALLTMICRAQSPAPHSVRHVVQISVDGLAGILLGSYLNETPRGFSSFDRLKREGASTMNARCDFDISYTLPNHTCMLTGRPVLQQPAGVPFSAPHGFTADIDFGFPWTLHNTGNANVPYKASVFDVTHDRGLLTAFFSGKPKFDLYVRSYNADSGAMDSIGENNGRNKMDIHEIVDWVSADLVLQKDFELATRAVEALVTRAPDYTFLHFADPDITGHTYLWGSEAYRLAVRNIDAQLGRIFTAIETNALLKDATFIVLTSDHGGGQGNINHLEPDMPGNYTIPMFVWGPGVPAGIDLYELFSNRFDPGVLRPDYSDPRQPLRNGDTGNIALSLLGLPPIPGSCMIPRFKSILSIAKTPFGFALSWPAASGVTGVEWADSCEAQTWHRLTNEHRIEPRTIFEPATNMSGLAPRFFRAINTPIK